MFKQGLSLGVFLCLERKDGQLINSTEYIFDNFHAKTMSLINSFELQMVY